MFNIYAAKRMICAFVREQAVTLSLNLLLLTSSATWSKLPMINVTSFTFPKQPRHREKNSAQRVSKIDCQCILTLTTNLFIRIATDKLLAQN